MSDYPSMAARLGADDLELFNNPQRRLLREITGIEPERAGLYVLLDAHGVRSAQRLALSEFGGGLVAALWPAELKPQAEYLYGARKATPMVAAARERGWIAEPSPHIGFFNSTPALRLYLSPSLDAADYARRWETGDLEHVHQYPTKEVRTRLWPWLRERGYADEVDDGVLEQFLTTALKRRPAHLRPGLRLKRLWSADSVRALSTASDVAATIRRDVDAILAAAGEPLLPG